MYTFFHHRKLINDSVEESFIKICQPYCDPLNNQDGFCPIPCLTRCYPTCNNSIILIDTPPPPPISISSDDDPQVRSHKLSIFFTLSLAVLAATFLLFSIYTAYKFYQRRFVLRRNQSNPPQGQRQEEVPIVREFFVDQDIGSVVDHPIWYIRTVGLQPAVISSIGTVKYKRGDGLVEGTDCSVCLNEFQEDEILRLLPKCEHAFHIACIDTWLRSHTNCPLCRAPIVITTSANSQSSDQRARARSLSNVVESQIQENRESEEREVEIEVPQSRVEIDLRDSREDDGISGSEENGVHFLRRSVSMDSLAASAISAAIANAVQLRSERNLDKQSVEMMMTSTGSSSPKQVVDSSQKDLNSVCSSSNEPKGPSFMVKRSLSCSAKVFLSRYSRSKSSTPPPPPLPPAPLP